jgi:acetyl esterase/lipase
LDSGVAFAAINYRFRYLPGSDTSDPQRAGIQNILRDAARAIQFVRHNCEDYNIDDDRIACYGGSAGAGTSIWLAFHDDLADPNNEDPVLRQSSRISAAGMLAGQYTYDMEQWDDDFADRGGDLLATHGGKEEDIALFFGMNYADYLKSDVRDDVDMRGLISSDDPPVFALTGGPDQEIADVGIYYHHPRHAMLIEKRCKKVGVNVVCMVPKVRKSDAAALKQEPNMLMNFLFEHLDVKPN